MTAETPPTSPRIATLERALTSDNTDALDIFWQEILAHGTPLIEPIEGDSTHNLVTFL